MSQEESPDDGDIALDPSRPSDPILLFCIVVQMVANIVLLL
jgi:hypothetical protein